MIVLVPKFISAKIIDLRAGDIYLPGHLSAEERPEGEPGRALFIEGNTTVGICLTDDAAAPGVNDEFGDSPVTIVRLVPAAGTVN